MPRLSLLVAKVRSRPSRASGLKLGQLVYLAERHHVSRPSRASGLKRVQVARAAYCEQSRPSRASGLKRREQVALHTDVGLALHGRVD